MEPSENRSILIAYDDSPTSRDALALGRILCEAFGAEPMLVECVRFPRYLIDPADLEIAAGFENPPGLEEAAESLTPFEAKTRVILDESPVRAILEVAERVGPLAIVVGSSHRGELGRTMLGTTGKALVAGSPFPVAIAPRGYADADHRIERICVGIDQGDEAQVALSAAIDVSLAFGASLAIASVMNPAPVSLAWLPGEAMGEIETHQRRYVAELLEDAASRVPDAIRTSVRRLEGDPAIQLSGLSGNFGLLVVGSRGYGPLRRVMLGSVSASLADKAKCPLLVLPRGARVQPGSFADIPASSPLAAPHALTEEFQ